jgi:hypothetical protein
MNQAPSDDLESDTRFPSGPWVGFFLQRFPPLGRQLMEMRLTFRKGQLSGEGRDLLGPFVFTGRYDLADGRCHWTKRYVGRHDVFYQGFNEGKGIWGTWEIPADQYRPALTGGFHIWPEGMADPTGQDLKASADLPIEEADDFRIIRPEREFAPLLS